MTSRHRRCACRTVLLLTGLLSAVTCLAAVRADEHSAHQPSVVRYNSRGLAIDVGRFLPAGRNVRVLIGRRTSGRRRIRVDVERPGRTGVHVNLAVPARRQADDHAAAPAPAELGPADTSPESDAVPPKIPYRPPVRAPKPSIPAKSENYLGLFTAPVPTALRAQLADSVPVKEGLLVTHVVPASPAANAGIKPYDILLRYDGHAVRTTSEVKRWIVNDRPGHRVVLNIVRSARRQTITIVVGTRTPTGSRSRALRLGTAHGSRWVQLRGRKMIVLRREGPSGRVSVRPATIGPARTVSAAGRTTRSFSIRCDKNRACRLRVHYLDNKGKTVQRDFEGTAREIQGKIASLPPTVRPGVLIGLKEISRNKKRRSAFRFRLQPDIQGGRQVLRLIIGGTTPGGVTRLFQLEQVPDGHRPLSADDLLKNEALTEELKRLSPTVRAKIIATLHRVRFPTILVKVRNSL